VITIHVPIRLESEANGSHGHWSLKAMRAKAARQAVTAAFIDAGHPVHLVQVTSKKGDKVRTCPRFACQPALPVVVYLTRIAPRQLDDDNAARACKAARDQVAELLGVDDRDPRITWRVEQRRGGVGEYALEIAIAPRGEGVPA